VLGTLCYDKKNEHYDVCFDVGGTYGGMYGGEEMDVLVAGKWRRARLERTTIDELTNDGWSKYVPIGIEFWSITDCKNDKLIPLKNLTGLTVDIKEKR
jgi:hypothetical protein